MLDHKPKYVTLLRKPTLKQGKPKNDQGEKWDRNQYFNEKKKSLGVGAWWKGRPQLSGIDLLHENKSENGFPFRHWQGLSFNGLVMYFRVHCEKKIMRCQL